MINYSIPWENIKLKYNDHEDYQELSYANPL